jgi:hypothetical protein
MMQSLPSEILLHIFKDLDPASRWPFARLCRIFYKLARPSLFETLDVNVTIVDGRTESDKMTMHRKLLRGDIGNLVNNLTIGFKIQNSGSGVRTAPDENEAGIGKVLGTLLSMTPRLRALSLQAMGGTPWRQTFSARSHESRLFRVALCKVPEVHTIAFFAQRNTRSSWWFELILPSLIPTIDRLCLLLDSPDSDAEDQEVEWMIRGFGPRLRTALLEINCVISNPGRPSDRLLDFLLTRSPLLAYVKVLSSHDELTEAHTTALFGPLRTHKALVLEVYGIPEIPEGRLGLSQQTHLTHISVLLAGSDFLYYLPSLPASILDLDLTLNIAKAGTEVDEASVTLKRAFVLVKPSLANTAWCPKLGRLSLQLRTRSSRGSYWDKQVGLCIQMRSELLGLLHSRVVQPTTDETFWKLENECIALSSE